MTTNGRIHPYPGQRLGRVENLSPDSCDLGSPVDEIDVPIDRANVVTSEQTDGFAQRMGLHKVLIDIDMPIRAVPSTTPGHFHLFIDHELSWPRYLDLLRALTDAGIVQEGYYEAARLRGHTTLRLPWIRKPAPVTDLNDEDAA